MTDSAAPKVHSNPVRRLLGLVGLMVTMYLGLRTLRFSNNWYNLAFYFLFLLLPFVALRLALRLRRRAKILAVVVLAPLLAFSSIGLLAFVACDIPAEAGHRELSRELSTVRQGRYSLHLVREQTAAGAVGPHGVGLEQRMTILPGLYTVKYLDYFEGASEGSLSVPEPSRIELYIPNAGYSYKHEVHRVYLLKPWVYF